MIKFFVPGVPTPKGRPRAAVRETTGVKVTKYGPILTRRARPILYTSAKTMIAEDAVRNAFLEKYRAEKAIGPLRIDILAIFKPPASASRAARRRMLDGEEFPTGRPDVDNVLKLVMDALEGLAYQRDSQVVTATARKRYGIPEGIKVEIERTGAI